MSCKHGQRVAIMRATCLQAQGLKTRGLLVLGLIQRVQVPNNQVLGIWLIVLIVQVLGKCMIITYLDL